MSLFWLWIGRLAWRARRKGSSEPHCSPRTEGTAGTQHPSLSHSIPHSYAQGHTGTFSSLSALMVSPAFSMFLQRQLCQGIPLSISPFCLSLNARCSDPRGIKPHDSGHLFLWSSISSAYCMLLCLQMTISPHSVRRFSRGFQISSFFSLCSVHHWPEKVVFIILRYCLVPSSGQWTNGLWSVESTPVFSPSLGHLLRPQWGRQQ